MKSFNQKGSSHLVALLALVLVGVIGYAGWHVMQANKTDPNANSSSQTVAAAVPSKIVTKAQANQATKALDSDSLDSSLNTSQLDSDLSSVL